MQIAMKWLYADKKTIIKNSHVLTVDMPVKINLVWKQRLTKQVEKYCRKDVRCSVSIDKISYNLSSRNPFKLVSNIAKIIIENKPNKLTFGNVTQNYVKY